MCVSIKKARFPAAAQDLNIRRRNAIFGFFREISCRQMTPGYVWCSALRYCGLPADLTDTWSLRQVSQFTCIPVLRGINTVEVW
jgi:hypothetical protein